MVISLDPSAPPFKYQGSMIFMGPAKGVCFDFQFGRCSQNTHHEKQDGEMQLHICQPCFEIRQLLVHHTCSGRHPGHGHVHGSGDQKLGAMGCPTQIGQLKQEPTPSLPPSNNIVNNNNNNNIPELRTTTSTPSPSSFCQCCEHPSSSCSCVRFKHTPDALCSCPDCARFVRIYHNNLEKLCRLAGEPEFDLYSTYYDFHSEDRDDDDGTDSEISSSIDLNGSYGDWWNDSLSTVSESFVSSPAQFQSHNNLNSSFFSGYSF